MDLDILTIPFYLEMAVVSACINRVHLTLLLRGTEEAYGMK